MADTDIKYRLLGDVADLVRKSKDASDALEGTEKSAKKGGDALDWLKSTAAKLGLTFGIMKVAQFTKQMLDMASEAEDAGAKFEEVFGPALATTAGFVDHFANRAGFAKHELQDLMGTTGNVVQGLGATKDESAQLAMSLATMAGDVASFNGSVDATSDVLKAMTSALTGEREALKTYGIVVQEADVQQRALIQSGKTRASELTLLEKAQATVTLITERSANAMGDLDRNQDSTAATAARLSAKWKDQQVAIGEGLLPAWQELLEVTERWVEHIDKVARAAAVGTDWMERMGLVANSLAHGFSGGKFGSEWAHHLYGAKDAMVAFTQALEVGQGRGRAMSDALVELARQNVLGNVAMAELMETTGATGLQLANAADAALKLRDEYNLTEQQAAALEAVFRTKSQAADEMTVAERDAASETERLSRHMRDLEDQTDDTTDAVERQVRAHKTLAQQYLEGTSLIAGYVGAHKRYREAEEKLAEVQKDRKATVEEVTEAQLDLVAAGAELAVKEEELIKNAPRTEQGFVTIARQLGITVGQAKDLIAAYDELDGRVVKTFVDQVRRTVGNTNVSGHRSLGGQTGAGEAYVVGERGPEVFVPGQAGQVVPIDRLARHRGQSITVNVNGAAGDERSLARQIGREIARAARYR